MSKVLMKQEYMMFGDDEVDGNNSSTLLPLPSFSNVNYSCGFCAYELNLSSFNRNTTAIGVKYGKNIKRGIISFFTIDETRFTMKNKLQYLPYFSSKQRTWSLFRRCIELLCKNCGNHIGIAYKGQSAAPSPNKLVRKSNTQIWDGISGNRIYDINIRSLRPSSHHES